MGAYHGRERLCPEGMEVWEVAHVHYVHPLRLLPKKGLHNPWLPPRTMREQHRPAPREAEQRALLDEQSPGELRSPRDREMGAATSPAPTQDYSICAHMGADEMVADQDNSAAGDAALARALGEDEAGQPEPELDRSGTTAGAPDSTTGGEARRSAQRPRRECAERHGRNPDDAMRAQ